MLTVSELTYRIQGRTILDDLNLNIEPGQNFALAGENGAGKSTLIKITLDLIRNIERGSIAINGLDHHQPAARESVTYLPEKFDLKREVTGWQYLEFVFRVSRQPVDRERVATLCRRLDLDTDRLGARTATYSKGMKQKLGLISCFMLDKPLMILDEPLSGLDPAARYHFKQLLEEYHTPDRTIFYSTHMLADAEEICDRFAILHGGRIRFEGSPASCLQQFRAKTLEQAYMNCISGESTAGTDNS